jgi:hypothetical protein
LLREPESRRVVELIDMQAEGLVTSEQVIEAAEEASEDWADRLRGAADSAWRQALDVARAMATEAAATAYLAEADAEEPVRQQV